MDKTYIPNPIDTSDVTLSPELVKLANLLSANVHKHWTQLVKRRIVQWIEKAIPKRSAAK